MNKVQINNNTITIRWNSSVDDGQGVYKFIVYKEKEGKRYLFSYQIVELFADDTKIKYSKFRLEKVSDLRHYLDYYPYIKPFQDIVFCINLVNLDITKDDDLKNHFITKYDEKISFISSKMIAVIEDGYVLMSGYTFCNGKLILVETSYEKSILN